MSSSSASLSLAGCHRGHVGRTGKKATGCLRRARFLASAAHVDGNADADYVADEDDFRTSQPEPAQNSYNWAVYTSIYTSTYIRKTAFKLFNVCLCN